MDAIAIATQGAPAVLSSDEPKARVWPNRQSEVALALIDAAGLVGVLWRRIMDLSTAASALSEPMGFQGRPDQLLAAEFEAPAAFRLMFADGKSRRLNLPDLGIDPREVRPDTGRVRDGALTMQLARRDEEIVLDAASLRYAVDPKYAAEMDAAVERLLVPSADLERTADRYLPPQEWYDGTEDDLE